ncbi:ABC transporter substrate-binding protein [Citricoccus zhacaiensis]|uniref:ABC transporter substrate-binding protein n=1 Tax=Citricoccus zhacaiensis TaxID=489142 RepID=A0ABQ2LN23_9MICC|nr:metal ABC transporter substrate-binding protein [Citricoccus zhacaiensis]GGO40196.1 ABC transporter substrate-binding protein [Citricoccus zhacaiensis]
MHETPSPATRPAPGRPGRRRSGTPRRRILPLAALALTGTVLAGCAGGGSGEEAASGGTEPVAVATTTQLGSILDSITSCAGTTSSTVMGPGDDPHDFSPSSRQIAEMADVGLVVTNGLGLEAGMQTALDNATADGAHLVAVAPEVDPLPFAEHDGHEGGSHEGHSHDGHSHEGADPHFWMDVARMGQAAELIGAELAEVTGDGQYADCGSQAAEELAAVDAEVRQILEVIPEDRRTLVTDHAAYNYFAEAYGFEIAGVVVPGGSTDAEPSSGELAGLVAQMNEEGADALVTGAGAGNKLVAALSAETGGEVPVVELYEGGIGPEGSGAETYADAMVLNARTLAEALQ